MKRRSTAFLFALAAIMVFAGCGGKSAASDEAEAGGEAASGEDIVTLTWQSYDSYDKYEKVVEAFEADNPDIKIEYEEVSDFATKILTEATADALPDLLNSNTGTTQILADAGVLEKFDIGELEADEDYKFADFWDAAAAYCTYEGEWYSLPLDGGNYGWVYNVDMFETAGITVPEEGFTWEEFEAACGKLLAVKDEIGIEYPTIFNDLSSSIDMMYPLIVQAGGSYLEADGGCAWNSEAAVAAFEWVQGLVGKGYIPPIEKLGDGYDALITKFNAGQIAMARVALWNSTYLEDSVNWKVMNAPRGNGGEQGEVLFLNGIGISSTCKNYEAALRFVKYVTSEKGLALYLEDNTSPQIAVRRSQAELSVSMFEESRNMQLFNTGLAYAGYVDLTPTFADQQTIIGQYFDEIWHNDADIQTTLDRMVEQLNGLLTQ